MPSRPRDQISIVTAAGEFTHFESLELTTDLLSIAELNIKLGDDGSWPTVAPLVQPGKGVKVYCNNLLQFTGRFERNEAPIDPRSGAVLAVVARTKLSDAKYASADPKIKFKDVSIKDFILAIFAPLGFTAKDFLFAAATDVNLVTGKKRGVPDPVDLEPAKADQLKVNPPETIWEAAVRVLKRHHLMIWDGADGRILIGKPDDTQAPIYRLLCKRGPASANNNVLSVKPVKDWSELPSEVHVYGGGPKKDVTRAPFKGLAVDLDALAVAADEGHFNRRVIIPDDGAKTLDQATARAKREMAARSKAKGGWEAKADGWSQWDGRALTPFATNTTADVDVDVIGDSGLYLVHRISRTLDKDDGPTTSLLLALPGTYADL